MDRPEPITFNLGGLTVVDRTGEGPTKENVTELLAALYGGVADEEMPDWAGELLRKLA